MISALLHIICIKDPARDISIVHSSERNGQFYTNQSVVYRAQMYTLVTSNTSSKNTIRRCTDSTSNNTFPGT